ncbi:MAG: hypothetical protein ACK5ME_00800 [Parahaliea sp.]
MASFDALIPLIIKAPADAKTRNKWLELLALDRMPFWYYAATVSRPYWRWAKGQKP